MRLVSSVRFAVPLPEPFPVPPRALDGLAHENLPLKWENGRERFKTMA